MMKQCRVLGSKNFSLFADAETNTLTCGPTIPWTKSPDKKRNWKWRCFFLVCMPCMRCTRHEPYFDLVFVNDNIWGSVDWAWLNTWNKRENIKTTRKKSTKMSVRAWESACARTKSEVIVWFSNASHVGNELTEVRKCEDCRGWIQSGVFIFLLLQGHQSWRGVSIF